jgi:hypothetical protein
MRLDFFVEEPSAEAALVNLVPHILEEHYDELEYDIYTFQGKMDLLKKLPQRLLPYHQWMQNDPDLRVIVLVDRDDDDCVQLKQRLETMASDVGLVTRTMNPDQFHVINRIAIEELEAWFFGDVESLRMAYPRVSPNLGQKQGYRDPDAIRGGTWERLERILKDYHPGGLEKIRAAEEISQHMEPDRNRSKSFQVFRDALRALFK